MKTLTVVAERKADADRVRALLPDRELTIVHASSLESWIGKADGPLQTHAPFAYVAVCHNRSAERDAELLRAGFTSLIDAALADEPLQKTLAAILDRHRARMAGNGLQDTLALDSFRSDSPQMKSFFHTARKVAGTDTSLLILGETGVGKGRLARSIHVESRRSSGPFIAVHCAALAESLLETELFGHEAGAFTGATRARRGYFEMAHRGTLFLDEIGEISQTVQVKLLKALEDKQIQRVGAESPVSIDVRIISATNRDIEREVAEESFRADLFYRLAVITLTIPPLRDRPTDIERLTALYLEHFQNLMGKPQLTFSAEAKELFRRYRWPGNVRELINAVERSVLMSTGSTIETEDLPRRIVTQTLRREVPDDRGDSADLPLVEARAQVVAEFEKSYATRLLQRTSGRIGATAKLAGVNQRHLYDLMKRYGLKKEDFRG